MSHNPEPPTPSAFQSKEEQEKYIFPDSTLDKAFIISKIRSLLGEYTKEEEAGSNTQNPVSSPPSSSPFASPAPIASSSSFTSVSPFHSPPFVSPKSRARTPSVTTPPPPPVPRALHGAAQRVTQPTTPTHATASAAQTPTPTRAASQTTPVIAHVPTPSRVPPLSLTPSSTPGDMSRNDSELDDSIDNTEDENALYGPEKEKIDTCCILWDISSSPEHSKFLQANHILSVLQTTLANAQSARLVEVAIGIVGNMASVPSIAEDITYHEISTLITAQLFLTLDPPVLNETCRTIAACIYTPSCQDKWVEVMKANNWQVVQQILDILQNTLDQELLERVLNLAAILIYIEPLQQELVSRKMGSIVSQVLVEQMTGDNMPSEHVLELFLRVLEGIICAPAAPDEHESTLSDLNDQFIKCLCTIVARNDSEDIVAAAVMILYSIVVHETAVSVLANDEDFCRALIDLLSSDSTFEWSLLLAMIEVENSHALSVIDDCLESILNIAVDGKESRFVFESISKLKTKMEQHGSKFKSGVQKLNTWLKENAN